MTQDGARDGEPSSFIRTATMLAEAARDFRDPWLLIGSAAARLAGAQVERINDIDLLLSLRDLETLKERWRDIPGNPPPPSAQFRSAGFRRFETPLPVEAIAEFELKTERGEWMRIAPKTRVRHGDLYAPSVAEQIEILRLMGREKDGPRIAALTELL